MTVLIYAPVIYLVSTLVFLVYLGVCLLWLCRNEGRRRDTHISKQSKLKIRACFQRRKNKLRKQAKDWVVSSLKDGEGHRSTTAIGQTVLDELKSAISELSREEAKSNEVKKVLKVLFMRNPFDLRGSRQLARVLFIYKISLHSTETYKPSMYNKLVTILQRRFCCCSLLIIKTLTFVQYVAWPLFIIFFDMFWSDTKVIYRLFLYMQIIMSEENIETTELNNTSFSNSSFTNFTEMSSGIYKDSSYILGVMLGLLIFTYLFSLGGMLSSPVVSYLKNSYKTAMAMRDVPKERLATPVPLDSVTRYDLSMNEANSESSWQSCLQWSTFLIIQLFVGTLGVKEDSNFEFQTLGFSAFMSIFSLTLSQNKGNRLLTQYTTTTLQMCIYFLACMCCTISNQLLLALCLVTFSDIGLVISWMVGGAIGSVVGLLMAMVGFISLIAILSNKRMKIIKRKFADKGILTANKGQVYLSVLSIQPLHLPSAKTRILTAGKTYYPAEDWYEFLLIESIVAYIIISVVSLFFFTLSYGLLFYSTASADMLPFSSTISEARSIFLIIASFCIPIGWIFATVLESLFYYLDNGALSCRKKFLFQRTEGPFDLLSEVDNILEDRMDSQDSISEDGISKTNSISTQNRLMVFSEKYGETSFEQEQTNESLCRELVMELLNSSVDKHGPKDSVDIEDGSGSVPHNSFDDKIESENEEMNAEEDSIFLKQNGVTELEQNNAKKHLQKRRTCFGIAKKVTFMFETGRWVDESDDEDKDNEDEETGV